MGTLASIPSELWHDQLVAHGKQGVFLVLVGFIGAFGFIRVSARLGRSPRFTWWPGSVVSESGVHLHHLVWGICLMGAAGTVGFATLGDSPWLEICAALFGIGAGLTIDEFALWVHLDDVYWAREGRTSIDAAVIAGGLMALVLLGARPFDVEGSGVAGVIIVVVVVLGIVATVGMCFAKGRILHGVTGFFFWPVAIYGALRIGKPGAPWARRFYGARNPGKQAKAERRFAAGRRTDRLKGCFRDAVGGSPTAVYEAKLAARATARERERARRSAR